MLFFEHLKSFYLNGELYKLSFTSYLCLLIFSKQMSNSETTLVQIAWFVFRIPLSSCGLAQSVWVLLNISAFLSVFRGSCSDQPEVYFLELPYPVSFPYSLLLVSCSHVVLHAFSGQRPRRCLKSEGRIAFPGQRGRYWDAWLLRRNGAHWPCHCSGVR